MTITDSEYFALTRPLAAETIPALSPKPLLPGSHQPSRLAHFRNHPPELRFEESSL
jgi:hypothetical protein